MGYIKRDPSELGISSPKIYIKGWSAAHSTMIKSSSKRRVEGSAKDFLCEVLKEIHGVPGKVLLNFIIWFEIKRRNSWINVIGGRFKARRRSSEWFYSRIIKAQIQVQVKIPTIIKKFTKSHCWFENKLRLTLLEAELRSRKSKAYRRLQIPNFKFKSLEFQV